MIVLITPTGARPAQFELCKEFMRRQDYAGEVSWIVVDDCLPVTTKIKNFRWPIIPVLPRPAWKEGQNTQGRNLKAGIDALKDNFDLREVEMIAVIEDDDYYRPEYLTEMRRRIEGFNAAGETHTVYYNLPLRRWWENQNDKWSSLFQTVFTPKALRQFEKLYNEKFIDYCFFPSVTRKNLFRTEKKLSIGMKGQPGRAGIGAGHKFIAHMHPDTDLVKLREFIDKDVNLYL